MLGFFDELEEKHQNDVLNFIKDSNLKEKYKRGLQLAFISGKLTDINVITITAGSVLQKDLYNSLMLEMGELYMKRLNAIMEEYSR